jgi:hypothetical protein
METFEQLAYQPLAEPAEKYWAAIKQADDELDKLAANPDYQTSLTTSPFEMPTVPITAYGYRQFSMVPYSVRGTPGGQPWLRTRNYLYFYAQKGEPISFTIAYRQIGSYHDQVQALLVKPDGSELGRAVVGKDLSGIVTATAEATGLYGLIVDSGSNACEVTQASHTYAVSAEQLAGLIDQVPPMYILPLPGTTTAELTLNVDSAAEGIMASIETDTGISVARQAIRRTTTLKLSLPKGTRYLVLKCERLPDSVLEDVRVQTGAGLYPFVATSEKGLLREP